MAKFKGEAGKLFMTSKGQIIRFKNDIFETTDKVVIEALKNAVDVEEVKASKDKTE